MGRDQIPSSSSPVIINKTLANAGVEESEVLILQTDTSTLKKIMIKSRTSNPLKFSWVSGGPYITIPVDQTYWDDGLDVWEITLYLVGTLDGQVAEIQVWK